MKTCFKRMLFAAAVAICVLGLVGWTAEENVEIQAVKEAFIGAQDISYRIGCFESENGKTDYLSEEAIQTYIDSFNMQIDQYYSNANVCRQTYKEINEQLLREICRGKVYYSVDGGVLECVFDDVNIGEDGDVATVKAVCTVWGNWVEENDSGALNVVAPIGRDTITATMVKEDGKWKLEKINEMYSELGADVINELETQQQYASEIKTYTKEQLNLIDEYVEKTYFTEYTTFEEALNAAKSLNPDEINPFALETYIER